MKTLEIRTRDEVLIATFIEDNGQFKVLMSNEAQGSFQNYIDYGIDTYFVNDSGIQHLEAYSNQPNFLEKLSEFLKVFSNFQTIIKDTTVDEHVSQSFTQSDKIDMPLFDRDDSQWEQSETVLEQPEFICEFPQIIQRNQSSSKVSTLYWFQRESLKSTPDVTIQRLSFRKVTQPDKASIEVTNYSDLRRAS